MSKITLEFLYESSHKEEGGCFERNRATKLQLEQTYLKKPHFWVLCGYLTFALLALLFLNYIET